MALIACPDCKKDVSDKSPHCLQCGCPITPVVKQEGLRLAAHRALAASGLSCSSDQKVTLGVPTAVPPQIQAQSDTKPGNGCGKGCTVFIIVCAIAFVIIYITGANMPDAKLSESFKSGEFVGSVSGNMAMRQGRARETDEEKERAAWSIAESTTVASKEDWVAGYKAGWDEGYDRH